jgi:hypothetical protein
VFSFLRNIRATRKGEALGTGTELERCDIAGQMPGHFRVLDEPNSRELPSFANDESWYVPYRALLTWSLINASHPSLLINSAEKSARLFLTISHGLFVRDPPWILPARSLLGIPLQIFISDPS